MRFGPLRPLARRLALLAAVATLAAPAVPPTPVAAAGGTVTVRGTVHQVIGDDFRRGTSRATWFVRTATERVPLVVDGGGLPAFNGRDAVIRGTRLPDGSVRVDSARATTPTSCACSRPGPSRPIGKSTQIAARRSSR